MNKTLELQFLTEEGATSTFSIEAPKEPVDPAEIKMAMENILAEDAFVTPTGGLVSIKGARVVERGTQEIQLA